MLQPAVESPPAASFNRRARFVRGWKRFAHGGLPAVGLFWLLVLVATAIFTPQTPTLGNVFAGNEGPSLQYPFGTDAVGQSLLYLCMQGIQYTLLVSCTATLISAIVGMAMGLTAGMAAPWLDQILMRITDLFFSFPSFVAAVSLMFLLGHGDVAIIMIIGLTQWAGYSRLTRALVRPLRESDLAASAEVIGATKFYASMRYIFPSVVYNLLVYTAFNIVNVITLLAMLSFFAGLQPPPPAVSFGSLIELSVTNMLGFPWEFYFPVLALASILFAFTVVGDGLQAWLNPKGANQL